MTDHQTFDPTTAIGRFGVAYVRKVCAHAHVGFSESDPDEDVLAIDADIKYRAASTRVQIKTTTKYSLTDGAEVLSLALEPAWVLKWRENINPAYLILVLVSKGVDSWVAYNGDHTLTNAFALWARIDNIAADADHLAIKRSDRFTVGTVGAWHHALYEGYGEGEAS
jgi:hypothetical protein